MKNRSSDFETVNRLLKIQNQHIAQMRLYPDEEQENMLNFRGKIIKNNYKYLKKMDKADEMIRTAKEINAQMLEKNKRALYKLQKEQPPKYQTQQKAQVLENGPIQPVVHLSTVEKKLEPERREDGNPDNKQKHQTQQASQIDKLRQETSEQNLQRDPVLIASANIGKTLSSINHNVVINYFRPKLDMIKPNTSGDLIYKIMAPFYELCCLQVPVPLIKKYKNCMYFGQNSKQRPTLYEGFLIFHSQKKIYYGELLNEKKNGKGTQIDFENDIIYIGNFEGGKKNGDFTVIKAHQTYKGQLKKGLYHGFGELTTQFSTYKGYFQEGMRYGQGEEQFKSGLTIEGEFIRNKFSNHPKQETVSRSNTIITASNRGEIASRLKQSNLERQVHRSRKQQDSASYRGDNPQSIQVEMKLDRNVQFEPSMYQKKNYQEYHYKFGQEDDEDPLEKIRTKVNQSFRIKDSPKKYSNLQRRRTTSQDASLLGRK